jgi:hypothetical protein
LRRTPQKRASNFFYIRIPGDWQPLERDAWFETALGRALETAGVGSITGGGSQLGEGSTVEYCGIDVVASDRIRAIQVARDVLRARGCPRDAVIEEYLPEYCELPVWLDDA